MKVPPTGGRARHNRPQAHARFFEIRRHRAGPDPLTDELDHVEKPALGRWSCRSLLGLPSSPQHVSRRVARAEPVGLSVSILTVQERRVTYTVGDAQARFSRMKST